MAGVLAGEADRPRCVSWEGDYQDRRGEQVGDLVEAIVKAIVDEPSAVRVSEVRGERVSVIEVEVARSDLGKLIGRAGATATAIRTLLAAAGGKSHRRYLLEIIEE